MKLKVLKRKVLILFEKLHNSGFPDQITINNQPEITRKVIQ